MTEPTVYAEVTPADGVLAETAAALLAAADKLGLPANVVQFSSPVFVVPQDVADAAKLPDGSETAPVGVETAGEPQTAAKTPRKATPRKATAKPASK